METRFDSYYEEQIPYKMTLEELNTNGINERNFLAYMRFRGESFKFLSPKNYGDLKKVLHCQIVVPGYPVDLFNPLYEKAFFGGKDHWCHPYKIIITDVKTKNKLEQLYFSDFVSLFKKGIFEIVE